MSFSIHKFIISFVNVQREWLDSKFVSIHNSNLIGIMSWARSAYFNSSGERELYLIFSFFSLRSHNLMSGHEIDEMTILYFSYSCIMYSLWFDFPFCWQAERERERNPHRKTVSSWQNAIYFEKTQNSMRNTADISTTFAANRKHISRKDRLSSCVPCLAWNRGFSSACRDLVHLFVIPRFHARVLSSYSVCHCHCRTSKRLAWLASSTSFGVCECFCWLRRIYHIIHRSLPVNFIWQKVQTLQLARKPYSNSEN